MTKIRPTELKKVRELKRKWETGGYLIAHEEEEALISALKEASENGEFEKRGISWTYKYNDDYEGEPIVLIIYSDMDEWI